MYWADEMVPKRENGQAANRRLTRYIMLASLFHHATHTVHVHRSAVVNASGYNCESDCRSRGREFNPGPVPCFRGD